MRVLVADGDRESVSSLKRGLTDAGYTVDVALNGEHALWHAVEFDYDAVILDVTLPGLDGVQVAMRLRTYKPETPILMLVTRQQIGAHQRPLPVVSDAYVIRPIDLEALVAQLRTLAHNRADQPPAEVQVGGLRIRPATRQAWRGETELNLAPREFALLQLFLNHPGQVLSRRQILEQVWVRNQNKAPNLVDQYVLYLRRKIDRPFGVQQLETVRGGGYRLREQPTEDLAPGFPNASSTPGPTLLSWYDD